MSLNLGLIGLARKGGLIAMGEEPTGNACRMFKAYAVFTASDAAANSVRRASSFAELGGIPHIKINATKEELGAACGRSSLAMFAICDAGMALTIAKRFGISSPEQLEELEAAAAHAAAMRKVRKKK